MDNLDIQIVDSLTVNLNQEDYSTEGQVLNDIAVYVEDGQLLFDAALTLDSINLYTRETPDTINIKEITDGISRVENEIKNTAKESTLLAKFAELKLALNTIDFTAIEQAIQDVENITAREDTLIQGVGDIIKAVESIDFTDLENSIAEVKNAVVNIDLSALAKENTLTQGVNTISKKIDDINIPELDKSDLAKEQTLTDGVNTLVGKIDNIKLPEIDTTKLAKQGENAEATNSKILEELHILSSASSDDSLGKQDIVNAINLAGGNVTMDDSLTKIATVIRNIIANGVPMSNERGSIEINDTYISSAFDIANLIRNKGNIEKYVDRVTINMPHRANVLDILTKAKYIEFTNATGISYESLYNFSEAIEVVLPNMLYNAQISRMRYITKLRRLYMPKVNAFDNLAFNDGPTDTLIDLTIGGGATGGTFNLSKFSLSTVLLVTSNSYLTEQDLLDGFTNNREKWLWNLRNHFAALLGETTNGQVIFHANAYAALDEETITAFTSKGWTVASA